LLTKFKRSQQMRVATLSGDLREVAVGVVVVDLSLEDPLADPMATATETDAVESVAMATPA